METKEKWIEFKLRMCGLETTMTQKCPDCGLTTITKYNGLGKPYSSFQNPKTFLMIDSMDDMKTIHEPKVKMQPIFFAKNLPKISTNKE